MTTPRPLTPTNGSTISNVSQPVTLTVANAIVTGSATPTYTFEVATDSGFANKVSTVPNVAQGSSQTTLQLGTLASGSDYYWHARAQGGGTTGVFGATFKFTIGPAIVIGAPTPISPLTGQTTAGWPTLTVGDAPHTGPIGSLVYKFEVGTNAAFSTVLVSGTVPEAPGQTSFTIPVNQNAPPQATLFWRATAIDTADSIAGPPSATQSITYTAPSAASLLAAAEGLTLWSGVQPPGTPGHASLGGGWTVQTEVSFTGQVFTSPTLEELQVFDLLDRGMDPQSAINWMLANGYNTVAAWFPGPAVIGFPYEYMAFLNGQWSLVYKVGG